MSFNFLSGQQIGERLAQRAKALRLLENVSQQELAARAGVSFGTVRRFEQGETVTLDNFIRILKALGRLRELEALLQVEQALSIEQLEQLERSATRQRARRPRA